MECKTFIQIPKKYDKLQTEKWTSIKNVIDVNPVACNNPSGKIIIDFETTGLNVFFNGCDEPLEITAIDEDGNILINTLLKPYYKKEWPEAENIHGISPEMIIDAPYPHEILPTLFGILDSTDTIIGYNTLFDLNVLNNLGIHWNGHVIDVMEMFKPIYGQETKNWQHQRLTFCSAYYGYIPDSISHRSLKDVKATLYCYKCIKAGKKGVDPSPRSIIEPYIPELLDFIKRRLSNDEIKYTCETENKSLREISIFCTLCGREAMKGLLADLHSNMTDKEIQYIWNAILCYKNGISVTIRAKNMKQPYGGYLNPRDMAVFELKENDSQECLIENENIDPCIIGLVIDYLTRIQLGEVKENVFNIAVLGAERKDTVEKSSKNANSNRVRKWIDSISGTDNKSIKSACRIVQYDTWGRGLQNNINIRLTPNKKTCDNIRCMLLRTEELIRRYGPVISTGFGFGNGYSEIVSSGDGDYLTHDTLWDLKVSKDPPKKEHTLQLLMYYVMGKKSGKTEFSRIKRIGICNPRLNKIYQKEIDEISPDVIKQIYYEVLAYDL